MMIKSSKSMINASRDEDLANMDDFFEPDVKHLDIRALKQLSLSSAGSAFKKFSPTLLNNKLCTPYQPISKILDIR